MIKRTEILCPNCMKKKLLQDDNNSTYCDECGAEFDITGKNTVRYKKVKPKSIYDFADRDYIGMNEDEWRKLEQYTKVSYDDKQYDDSKYNWQIVYRDGFDVKYGRMAVSHEYKLRRGLTMGEFYGTSEVD